MKKFLVLILALSMVLCTSAFASLPIGTELTPTPEDYANTDLSEHKTVTLYLVGDGESTYSDFPEILAKVNEELAKFNTELDVIVVSWSDAGTVYPLILTGGEKADLIFTASWRNLWTGAADESFFTPDWDFIEKYMPYTFEYQPKESFSQITYNGKIQGFTQNYTPSSPSLIGIRTDLAEQYGLSTDIYTWEDLKTYMYGIAEHTEETGIFAFNAGQKDNVSSGPIGRKYDLHAPGRTGYFRFAYGDGSIPTVDELSFYYNADYYREICEENFQMAKDGIWSRSALSKTENNSQSFQNGTSAIIQWNYTIYQYMTFLEEQVLHVEKESATKGLVLYADDFGMEVEGYNNNAISILAGSEDPIRAAMVLDILKFNTTINTMICLGIEGRHFIDLGDGYYEKGPEFKNYTQGGMSWAWATQNDNWKGKPDRQDQAIMSDFCKAHSAINPTMSFVFDPEPVSAYSAAITATVEEYAYTLGLGLVDDLDVAYNEFMDALKQSGSEEYIAEYLKQYQAWYEMQ